MPAMLSVSQLNAYVKSLLDGDFNLINLYVCGEISNFTNHYRTGHLYFTLKDSAASVKAVMFHGAAQRLRFQPENGLKIVARCSVSLYERDGAYQLYVEDMQPDGLGALNLAFEQLKRKLEAKGMFDPGHKKPLPEYPERIAVITSPTGAAIKDILQILDRRYPYARILLVPVQVQGASAAGQLTRAVNRVNVDGSADLIIIGRGGGSAEDLWAFNDENLANAIFCSDIPVISAVGHETDVTIADFVADLRAPTPSAAAELAVPDYRDVLTLIDVLLNRAYRSLNEVFIKNNQLLEGLKLRLSAMQTDRRLERMTTELDGLKRRTLLAVNGRLENEARQLKALCARLDALSPMKVLSRGYAIAETVDGHVLKGIGAVQQGDAINILLTDGRLGCSVDTISMN